MGNGSTSNPLNGIQACIGDVVGQTFYVKVGGMVFFTEYEETTFTGYSPNDGSFTIQYNNKRIRGSVKSARSYTIYFSGTASGSVYIEGVSSGSDPDPEPTTYEYKIKFDLMGGEAGTGPSDIGPKRLTSSTYSFNIPGPEPRWKGHEFVYWAEDPDTEADIYDVGDPITVYPGTTYLHAIWRVVQTHTLEFSANGGDENSVPVLNPVTNSNDFYRFTIPSTKPKRKGYEFISWSEYPDGSGSTYVAGNKLDVYGYKILYATWKLIPIPITSIVLHCDRTTIEQYEDIKITATVSPDNATDKRIWWRSSLGMLLDRTNTSCTLSTSSAGTAVVSAESEANPNTKDEIEIVVTEYPLYKSLSLESDKSIILDNGEEAHISVIYDPPGSKYTHGSSLKWMWSDEVEMVSKDNNGCVVRGVKEGKAVVRVQPNAHTIKSVYITVDNSIARPVESISFFKPSSKVEVGEIIYFNIIVNPGNADDNQILWSSPSGFLHLEDLHAEYPTSGHFKAISVGKETIVATSRNNPNATASVDVLITPKVEPSGPVTEIRITGPNSVVVGTSVEFRALALPETAENRSVSNWWIVSGSDKISLTSPTGTDTGGYCVISGVKPGTSEIGAGDPNGVHATYSFKIVAKPDPTVTGPTEIYYSQLDSEHYWEYDASGFSNPDAVNWASSDTSKIDWVQTSGSHAKFESMKNSKYSADIIATSGSETARLTVQNIRTVLQLRYWNTGKLEIYTGETDTFAVFRMDPVDPDPSFTNFSQISGAKFSKVEFSSANTNSGSVIFKITGVSAGTDIVTVSNGLVSNAFEVKVIDKPQVTSINISGPDKVCSIEPADEGVFYTAVTAPAANAPVYWDVGNKVNIRDGVGGSTLKRRNSCEYRPQLMEGKTSGSFDVIAYYDSPGVAPSATKTVSVVAAEIKSVAISGPDEIENLEEATYIAKIELTGGNEYKLNRIWTVEGDGSKTNDTGGFIYVTADLKDKKEGKILIKLVVESHVATKEVKVIPKITKIVIQGVRYLDKDASYEFKTIVEPDNASKLPLKWMTSAGEDFVKLEYNESALLSHKATAIGLAPGDAKIKASNIMETTWTERLLTVKGNVYGSAEAPLESINGSLLTYIGDTIYVKDKASVLLKSQVDGNVDCHAELVTGGFGLRLSPTKGVEGNITKPGIIEVNAQYSDSDSEVSTHKTTIYSVALEGADGIDITGLDVISVGQVVRWTGTVQPADSAYKEVYFSVTGRQVRILEQGHNVAEGHSYCVIEGLEIGTAQITARSGDLRVEVTRNITVSEALPMAPPAAGDDTICCIDVYKKGAKPVRLYMPHVQSISESDTASLTEISTMVFGADNRFIMDLGTTKSYSVAFVRSNPPNYDDGSPDPEDWSNGKWYEYLIALLDFWQNFGITSNADGTAYERTGGFKFHFIPPKSAENLYPEIHKTVFLIGAVNPSILVGKLAFRMTLQVARMTSKSKNVPTVKITYSSNSVSFNESYTSDVPKGVSLPIGMPPQSWIDSAAGVGFSHWETEDGTEYIPGTFKSWDAPVTLLAQWKKPIQFRVFDTAGTYTYNVEDVRITTIDIFMVGAGGGSGRGDSRVESGGGPKFENAGGAGAGGEYLSGISIGVSTGDSFTIEVGEGGNGGNGEGLLNKHEDGEDGGDTKVTSPNLESALVARGGEGGRKYVPSTKETPGGKNFYAGGNGPRGTNAGNPGDMKGFGGKAGASFREGAGTSMVASAGGSGGGSCDLMLFPIDLADGSSSPAIRASGGSGGYRTGKSSTVPAGSGTYGGGAGSGPGKDGTKGADGVVVIIAY